MLFLVVVVQLSDVFQYVWGKTFGKHAVAPSVSPNKTWEGLIGGVLTATAIGAGLWWITPFTWWQTALLAEIGHRDVIDLGDISTARGTEMFLPLWLRLWGALGTATFNVKVVR